MEKFNKLVFIDDDEATNFYHQIILEKCNLSQDDIFFQRPEEALNYFEKLKISNEALPDVIFLDINMPKIDGWMFLKKFEDFDFEHTPIVLMLTTSLNPSDKSRAENNPLIKGLIDKPLTKKHLEDLLMDLNKSVDLSED